ncbi:MAG: ATP-binding protein [Bacteroidota bacterium]|nr:ATP-binding protein [Bacteroidota bacterium]
MEHNKKALLKTAYQRVLAVTLLDIKAPLRWIDTYVADNVCGRGTASDEIFTSKSAYRKIIVNARKQSRNMAFQARLLTKYLPKFTNADTAVFYDEISVKLGKGKQQFTLHLSVSLTFAFQEKNWQVISLHASLPDPTSSSADTFHIGEARKKLQLLEQLVVEKTTELQIKNKELIIEAALERVRSRSMAMHSSSEIKEVAKLLFVKMKELGFFQNNSVIIVLPKNNYEDTTHWTCNEGFETMEYAIPPFEHPVDKESREAWRQGAKSFEMSIGRKEKNAFLDQIFRYTDYAKVPSDFKKNLYKTDAYSLFEAFEKHCSIIVDTFSKATYSDEQKNIVSRFASVFEQAYIRFLDLERAEQQAREAIVENAIEKVRSRSLAMHRSEEIMEVACVVAEKLRELGMQMDAATILIFHETHTEYWIANKDSSYTSRFVTEPEIRINSVIARDFVQNQPHGKGFVKCYSKKEKNGHWKYLLKHSDFKQIPEERKRYILDQSVYNISVSFVGNISLTILRYDETEFSEEDNRLIGRFAKVFEQAYTRFTDLQKSETQAKEAQIEAALERLRARTMAMQNSNELSETVKLMFQEFRSLLSEDSRQIMFRGFITIIQSEIGCFDLWITETDGSQLYDKYEISFREKTTGQYIYKAWKQKQPYIVIDLQGPLLNEWLDYLISLKFAVAKGIRGKRRVNTFVFYSSGFVGVTSATPLGEEAILLLQRFAKVFDQTYTRFLDLQSAEAAAKEAIKQAALDRIRANIASMRTVVDLDRVTPIIWNELNVLDISFLRCGIFIIDESKQQIHTFLSSPTGTHIAAYYMRFQETPQIYEMVQHWRKREKHIQRWTSAEFGLLADSLYRQGAIRDRVQYLQSIPPEGVCLHFIPFMQGMLYVGNSSLLSEEEIDTLVAVADAFSTAYARYEDFNKLEQAKTQVENALADLTQAQKQLVQSEKMASLGELTAGIAHEIQNPLNFVNNFSEVSKELLEELRQELTLGNINTVQELMNDITQNLEKINHHGKRADSIVKGMLQHSRTSNGQKELIDINALCEEYLRLSYHGLRAKDSSFMSAYETKFEGTVRKIAVYPQEIGRVLLNLINNAFYAVNEKARKRVEGYSPKVKVKTQKEDDVLKIIVEDNGMGIPENIKEKIFQPFFTTKPTGQGTGLGLSLSYDIVKAHGGQLQCESEDGMYTIFKVLLPLQ